MRFFQRKFKSSFFNGVLKRGEGNCCAQRHRHSTQQFRISVESVVNQRQNSVTAEWRPLHQTSLLLTFSLSFSIFKWRQKAASDSNFWMPGRRQLAVLASSTENSEFTHTHRSRLRTEELCDDVMRRCEKDVSSLKMRTKEEKEENENEFWWTVGSQFAVLFQRMTGIWHLN